jgi:hypothetical protein
MRFTRSLAALLFFTSLLAAPAWAGPPLICHPIDIGSQHSLPWLATDGWNGADPAYDVSHLTNDTLDLLDVSTPVTVRMETLRRAAIYAARAPGLADALTIRLLGRTLQSQMNGRPDPSAWFDAGYFVETVHQGAIVYPALRGAANVDGLPLIRMAIRLGGAGMQPAVAVIERAATRP